MDSHFEHIAKSNRNIFIKTEQESTRWNKFKIKLTIRFTL